MALPGPEVFCALVGKLLPKQTEIKHLNTNLNISERLESAIKFSLGENVIDFQKEACGADRGCYCYVGIALSRDL